MSNDCRSKADSLLLCRRSFPDSLKVWARDYVQLYFGHPQVNMLQVSPAILFGHGRLSAGVSLAWKLSSFRPRLAISHPQMPPLIRLDRDVPSPRYLFPSIEFVPTAGWPGSPCSTKLFHFRPLSTSTPAIVLLPGVWESCANAGSFEVAINAISVSEKDTSGVAIENFVHVNRNRVSSFPARPKLMPPSLPPPRSKFTFGGSPAARSSAP